MSTPARRSRDAERTAADILRAAQQVFSTRSYSEAGVREITALANVTPALVNRYFGSKEKLFEAALADALDVRYLTEGDRADFGRRLASLFIDGRGGDEHGVNPLPMLVMATSDAGAREVALRLLNEQIMEPLVAWFGGPDAEDRAAQLVAVATGFFTFRLLLPLEPLAGDVSPAMRRWLAETLQAIVD
ncbi:MAG TPA: TetR family transcriptional regulator [Pseudomonadales bacterium]